MTANTFAKWGVAAILAIAPAFAQKVATANIPFDFNVGQTKMSAGDYTVRSTIPGTVLVTRDDGTVSAFALAMGANARNVPQQSSLVFTRYGDKYFLSQIWSGGDALGKELVKAKPEREIARILSFTT